MGDDENRYYKAVSKNRVSQIMTADFVYTSANDGTSLIRPVSARAETWFKDNNIMKKVIDNTEDFYVIKSVDGPDICKKIRDSGMDFTI